MIDKRVPIKSRRIEKIKIKKKKTQIELLEELSKNFKKVFYFPMIKSSKQIADLFIRAFKIK